MNINKDFDEILKDLKFIDKDKKFIVFQEPKTNSKFKLDCGIIKSLTGGDTLSGRRLYQEQETFKINAYFVLICNDPPALNSVDGGVIRRLNVCPFESQFVDNPTESYQKQLKDINTNELKYPLLNLLIKHYNENRLIKPQKVNFYTNEYIKESNDTINFIQTYMEKTDNQEDFFTKSELIEYLNNYKLQQEYEITHKNKNTFIKNILSKFCIVKDTKVKGKRVTNVVFKHKLKHNNEDD